MTEPPFPVTQQPTMTAARRMAFAAWDKLKGEDDPAAEHLSAETQMRLELFAKEIRNLTIDQVAGAVKRYYDKINNAAVESLTALKE